MVKILVTGGFGYIGSHTVAELIEAGFEPFVVDNFCNSDSRVLDRLQKITNKTIGYAVLDLTNLVALSDLFRNHRFDAVIHFAGLKSVSESISEPYKYYSNNLVSTLNLLECMQKNDVFKLVFSSSANIYGTPKKVPVKEEYETGRSITNPYGQTKYFAETILKDIAQSDSRWKITALRYFNPIGAHPSGQLGELPQGIPPNIFPYITQVASRELKELKVYGKDYPTTDGTGVRDYINIIDLATAHVAALRSDNKQPFIAYNVGTGHGTTVLQLIKAFEKATGIKIRYTLANRRPGDVAESYADNSKILAELDWKPRHTIEEACKWGWQWENYRKTTIKID